jgi:hypothetical protein
MPAYAAITPDDPFAASKGLLDALVREIIRQLRVVLTAPGRGRPAGQTRARTPPA